jgi:hypothetical protein
VLCSAAVLCCVLLPPPLPLPRPHTLACKLPSTEPALLHQQQRSLLHTRSRLSIQTGVILLPGQVPCTPDCHLSGAVYESQPDPVCIRHSNSSISIDCRCRHPVAVLPCLYSRLFCLVQSTPVQRPSAACSTTRRLLPCLHEKPLANTIQRPRHQPNPTHSPFTTARAQLPATLLPNPSLPCLTTACLPAAHTLFRRW